MKLKTTPQKLIEAGRWEAYCDATGTNPWCVNEGLMDDHDEIELDEETLRKMLGLEE